jgi:hypothetical protein
MAGNSHVFLECWNMGKKPQTLPSFEQKTLWKTYNIWSVTCAFKFCNVYSSVFVKEGQSFFFPPWQDFLYDSVPHPQGTSCQVIFGPRNKTVGISLCMANFVLCVLQVPEIKSSKESYLEFQGNVVVLVVELLKRNPQLSFQAFVSTKCFERGHIQYRLVTAYLFLVV